MIVKGSQWVSADPACQVLSVSVCHCILKLSAAGNTGYSLHQPSHKPSNEYAVLQRAARLSPSQQSPLHSTYHRLIWKTTGSTCSYSHKDAAPGSQPPSPLSQRKQKHIADPCRGLAASGTTLQQLASSLASQASTRTLLCSFAKQSGPVLSLVVPKLGRVDIQR